MGPRSARYFLRLANRCCFPGTPKVHYPGSSLYGLNRRRIGPNLVLPRPTARRLLIASVLGSATPWHGSALHNGNRRHVTYVSAFLRPRSSLVAQCREDRYACRPGASPTTFRPEIRHVLLTDLRQKLLKVTNQERVAGVWLALLFVSRPIILQARR